MHVHKRCVVRSACFRNRLERWHYYMNMKCCAYALESCGAAACWCEKLQAVLDTKELAT